MGFGGGPELPPPPAVFLQSNFLLGSLLGGVGGLTVGISSKIAWISASSGSSDFLALGALGFLATGFLREYCSSSSSSSSSLESGSGVFLFLAAAEGLEAFVPFTAGFSSSSSFWAGLLRDANRFGLGKISSSLSSSL